MYLHINPTLVVDQIEEIVALDDFVRDEVEVEVHVFVVGHGSHEVEIGEVHAVEFSIGSGNGGVDEEFGGDEIGCWRACVSIIGNAVAAHGEACVVWLLLVQTIAAHDASVSCMLVWGELMVMDEEAGVCTFDIVDALEEAPKFIGKTCFPDGAVFVSLDEMPIFENVACDVVNNGANEMEGVRRGHCMGRWGDAVFGAEKGLSGSDVIKSRA